MPSKTILWPGTHAQTTLMLVKGFVVSVPLVENGDPEAHDWPEAPAVYRKRIGRVYKFTHTPQEVKEAPPFRKNFKMDWVGIKEENP